jgi:hypothetical protein
MACTWRFFWRHFPQTMWWKTVFFEKSSGHHQRGKPKLILSVHPTCYAKRFSHRNQTWNQTCETIATTLFDDKWPHPHSVQTCSDEVCVCSRYIIQGTLECKDFDVAYTWRLGGYTLPRQSSKQPPQR